MITPARYAANIRQNGKPYTNTRTGQTITGMSKHGAENIYQFAIGTDLQDGDVLTGAQPYVVAEVERATQGECLNVVLFEHRRTINIKRLNPEHDTFGRHTAESVEIAVGVPLHFHNDRLCSVPTGTDVCPGDMILTDRGSMYAVRQLGTEQWPGLQLLAVQIQDANLMAQAL